MTPFDFVPHWLYWVMFGCFITMLAMLVIKKEYQYHHDKWLKEHPEWVEQQHKINQYNADTFKRLMEERDKKDNK